MKHRFAGAQGERRGHGDARRRQRAFRAKKMAWTRLQKRPATACVREDPRQKRSVNGDFSAAGPVLDA